MKNKTVLITVILLAILATACFCMTSCATEFQITWDVPEHAAVTIEGADKLPTKMSAGELEFSVAVDSGWEISEVKVTYEITDSSGKISEKSTSLRAKNGVYTYEVSSAIKVSIGVEKILESVVISQNPTKLQYIAGEAVDTSGMEVKAVYADGSEKIVTDYTLSTSAFVGGETSFDVIYNGKSATVNLTSAVEYLATIDPAGGTISDDVLDIWKTYNNYNVSDDGVITFTFLTLPATFAKPTSEQISRSKASEFTFKGFSGSVSSSGSFTLTATWEAALVNINSVRLVLEDGVPYLVINLSFNVTEEAYLYLYEGKQDINLKGPTIAKDETQETQDLKFDLTELSDTGYYDRWMDIKFCATMGDRTETQEVHLDEHYLDGTTTVDPDFVDLNTKIAANGYNYQFQIYNNLLKVSYSVYTPSYTITFDESGEHLYITSPANSGYTYYAGKYVKISWWNDNAESPKDYALINDDGSWQIVVDTADFTQGKMGYAHFTLLEATESDGVITEGEVILGSESTNLPISSALNDNFVALGSKAGGLTSGFEVVRAADNAEIFVGRTADDGVIVYICDPNYLTLDEVALSLEDGKVYYILRGSFGSAYTEEKIKSMTIDLENSKVDYAEGKQTISVDMTNCTYELKVDVTDLSPLESGDALYPHRYFDGVKDGDVKYTSTTSFSSSVTYNGKTYSIKKLWSMPNLLIEAE